MMDAVELDLHRKNTKAFIGFKPSVVVLQTQERVKTPSGGYKMTPSGVRVPQTFRIIELGMKTQPQEIRMQDGKIRKVVFWLLGEHDASVAVDDFWIEEGTGRHWQVGDLIRDNGYETRALVVEVG